MGPCGTYVRAALVASCLRGALPPVLLRAVCLARAIVGGGEVEEGLGSAGEVESELNVSPKLGRAALDLKTGSLPVVGMGTGTVLFVWPEYQSPNRTVPMPA